MTIQTLTDPIVQFCILVIASLTIGRLLLRRQPRLRLAGAIAFFVVLTVLLLYHGIQPYESDSGPEEISRRIFIGIAKAVWWIGGAMVLVSFVRLFLIFERKPREGRLLQDLIVGIIY